MKNEGPGVNGANLRVMAAILRAKGPIHGSPGQRPDPYTQIAGHDFSHDIDRVLDFPGRGATLRR